MKKFGCLLLTLISFFSAPIAYAGNSGDDEALEEFYKAQFAGWKGIVFYCDYDTEDQILEQICSRAKTDLELLGVSNNIDIKIAKSNEPYEIAVLSGQGEYIRLEYSLITTNNGNTNSVKAVYGNLSFNLYYSDALEQGHPNRATRSGTLVMVDWDLIASGPRGAALVNDFSDAAETLLKKAITGFLKGNR